jgi:5-methylcytosine-specific restriction protein A
LKAALELERDRDGLALMATTRKARLNPDNRGWRAWYQLQRWRRRAQHQLQMQPLCETCRKRGVVTVAVLADHVDPHSGDEIKFWLGELQSLCASCHQGTKSFEERHGFSRDVGLDGAPLDPRHPANRPRPI